MNPNLNEEQRRYVESDSNRICCLAGAGAGKTFALIERVVRLIEEEKATADEILVLTFTNAAAFEMRERCKRRMPNFSKIPQFQTFHAFCYSLLMHSMKVRAALGYTACPTVATAAQIKTLRRKVVTDFRIKLTDKQLDNPRDALSLSQQADYDIFWKRFKVELRSNGYITFDVLSQDVCKLFVGDDQSILKYKKQFRYLIVDEFQDTDITQWNFVKSFEDSNIAVTGDCLQTLYRFRGCTPEILMSLSTDPKWEVIKMQHNYRSTKQIVEYANSISKDADPSYRITMIAEKEGPVVAEVPQDYTTFSAFSQENLSEIKTYLETLTGTTAILCRTNAEVKDIRDYLDDNDIEYSVRAGSEDAQMLFAACRDNEVFVDYISANLDSETFAVFRKKCLTENIIEVNDNLKALKPFLESSYNARNIYQTVVKLRHTLRDEAMSPLNKYYTVLKLLNFKSRKKVEFEYGATFEDIKNKILEVIGEPTTTNLYVGTIHSSKGLEYDNVIVMGVDSSTFRLDNEDNIYCYYVAATRARTNLTVFRQ